MYEVAAVHKLRYNSESNENMSNWQSAINECDHIWLAFSKQKFSAIYLLRKPTAMGLKSSGQFETTYFEWQLKYQYNRTLILEQ